LRYRRPAPYPGESRQHTPHKRGGNNLRDIDDGVVSALESDDNVLALNAALEELAAVDERRPGR
jgi:hypothetical protein